MRERKKTHGAEGSPDDDNSSDSRSVLYWIYAGSSIALQPKSSASVGPPRTWAQESGRGTVRDNATEGFDSSEYRNEQWKKS
jgi:hypothetical protein